MKKKILVTGLAVLVSVSMLFTGCGKPKEEEEVPVEEVVEEVVEEEPEEPKEEVTPEVIEEEPEEPKEPIPDGMAKSILTGEYVDEAIGKRRPVAFMIENTKGGYPHYGISHAEVIYEAPVEAELTRECAIFEDWEDVERIGSMRSCRDYFISYAAGFDSIYCHYGQAAYALPYLESDNVDNLSGLAGYTGTVYYRTSDKKAPFNAYASGEGVKDGIELLNYRKDLKDDFKGSFNFAWVGQEADMSAGTPAKYVAPGYPSNRPWFDYNEEDQLYYRYEHDRPEIDGANDEQIKVTNIVLEYDNATTYDVSQYVHFDTTSGGKGKYISKGKAVDIIWVRENFYSPSKYYLIDGTELVMNPGRTFVCIIKNKNIESCVIGESKDTAECVVDEAAAQEAVKDNADWESNFKANETEYRAELDKQLADILVAHEGKSKVEQGLYK